MNLMSKVKVFVPAPKNLDDEDCMSFRFPRLRLINLIRRVMLNRDPGLNGVITLVNNEWPKLSDDNGDRERFLRQTDKGVGIEVSFIGDDAMIGRICRVRNDYSSMGYIICSIEPVEPEHDKVFICTTGVEENV
jgi:hypothetical protein